MKFLPAAAVAAISFALGLGAAHLPRAAAASSAAPLEPAAIDLLAVDPQTLPPPSALLPRLQSRTLVAADGMSAAIQIGTVAKHVHTDVNEIQYIVEGSGTEWLADRQISVKPGMLIIVPKGTAHGGYVETAGHLKVLSIKTPPQDPSDIHFLQ